VVSITVALGERSYPVRVGRGLLARLGEWTEPLRGHRAGFLCDDGVPFSLVDRAARALEGAGLSLARVNVRAGESQKCLAECEDILDRLIAGGLERGSPLFVIGGGMATDLGGFCAAVLFRGVPLVLLPTTLLAQCDAAVGGKVGVNLRAGKNLAGAFWQPSLVVSDIDTLATLPQRELRNGLAEVVKSALVGDAGLLDLIEARAGDAAAGEPGLLEELVARAVRVKAAVVASDERETSGARIILNFGHTVGHALEATSGFDLRHGEAVTLGMIAALRVGARLGLTPPVLEGRVRKVLSDLGLPTDLDEYGESCLGPAKVDKKRSSGRLQFVCLRAAGEPTVVTLTTEELSRNLRP